MIDRTKKYIHDAHNRTNETLHYAAETPFKIYWTKMAIGYLKKELVCRDAYIFEKYCL